jgi:hypothetical protein
MSRNRIRTTCQSSGYRQRYNRTPTKRRGAEPEKALRRVATLDTSGLSLNTIG